jgi:hypothetical protein
MELPASSAPYAAPRNENKGWNSDLQQHLQNTELKNGYDAKDGIRNVNYNNQPYNMICETIFSLAENYPHPYRSRRIDPDTQNAVKQYVNHIYDSNWKLQMDTWIMRDGIVQAYLSGVKFIVLPDNLWNAATVRDIIPTIVPDRYLITNQELLPQHATWLYPFVGEDPGYHGAPESQEYLADAYYKIITEWQD